MKALVLEADWQPREGYALSEFEAKNRKARSGCDVWKFPRLSIQDVPVPKPGPEEVLIRVKACGICGSDIHMAQAMADGYINYPGYTKFPSIPGHEFAGIVEEVGQEVTGIKIGDFVTADNMVWCGNCTPCRNGQPNFCQNMEEFGFTISGAFAEYTVINARCVWSINDLVDAYGKGDEIFEAGALVEPTTVSYNAIFAEAGGFLPGAYVVVYGAGPIGLGAIAIAKAAGATKVIVFEPVEARIEPAKEVGADYVFNPIRLIEERSSPHAMVMEVTNGMGADMQIEAAGAASEILPEMEKSLAIKGKVVLIGRSVKTTPMYLEAFQSKGAKMFGALGHAGHGNYPNVIRLMSNKQIDMTKIITTRYGLDDAITALQDAEARGPGKTMIKL
jgi:hypothetical protein